MRATIILLAAYALSPLFGLFPMNAGAQDNTAKLTVEDVAAMRAQIEADPDQLKVYCEIVRLYDEAYDLIQANDTQKAGEIVKQADEAGKRLGSAFEKVMSGLQTTDLTSEEGRVIAAAMEPLEQKCR